MRPKAHSILARHLCCDFRWPSDSFQGEGNARFFDDSCVFSLAPFWKTMVVPHDKYLSSLGTEPRLQWS